MIDSDVRITARRVLRAAGLRPRDVRPALERALAEAIQAERAVVLERHRELRQARLELAYARDRVRRLEGGIDGALEDLHKAIRASDEGGTL